MGVLRLGICVGGVYAAFLLWAIAQERLSAPFLSTITDPTDPTSSEGDRFPSPLFLNYAQALASCLSATSYLLFNAWRSGNLGQRGLWHVLGFEALRSSNDLSGRKEDTEIMEKLNEGLVNETTGPGLGLVDIPTRLGQEGIVRRNSAVIEKGQTPPHPTPLNGGTTMDRSSSTSGSSSGTSDVILGRTKETVSGSGGGGKRRVKTKRSLPILLIQVSTFQTIAGPIGFLALRHISFPTMVLGKSCKLIPVMMLNVLLYRRRFSAHKYLVVALVTAGISVFMLLAPAKHGKGGGQDSLWGLSLLLFNLFVDGLTNSTQDQIFTLYPHYTGQQMMFHMSLLAQLFLLPLILLPLPSSPSSLLHHLPIPLTTHLLPSTASAPLTLSQPAFFTSISFLLSHPTALPPLLAYALLGGLGQLFIFETIQHFGSLTLTMVTVTRKLFTMLLSVLVFEHKLSVGQWIGVGIVFAGIGVEAGVKRRDVARKARRD